MSLRLRLLLAVSITFMIVVVGSVFAAHVSASNGLRGQVDRFLLQRSEDGRIQSGLRVEPGPFPGPRGSGPQFAEPDAITQFIRSDGTVAQPGEVPLPVTDADRALAANDGKPHFQTVTVDSTPYRILTVHVPGGAAQIARSIKETNDVLGTLDIRLLVIALVGTAIAALAAWVIARRIVRPVEQLTDGAVHVAHTQDLESTIPVDRNDELGRLASSFNTMLVALRNSRDQQKRLVMDASHEMRTPLTALRTNIDLLARAQTLDEPERAELIAAVQVELNELSELVAELVDLATDARAEEPVQTVDLGEVASNVVERYRRRSSQPIELDVRDHAPITGRAGAIERAISNLVDNACKFSQNGAPVEVTVAARSVEVADRGPGIEAEDRAHVFDRFYRAPAARTMPGSGLGLSIVKQIAELHGGSVQLVPREGGGTIARLSLGS
jgi:two-component system sensor histidine kinase MprB